MALRYKQPNLAPGACNVDNSSRCTISGLRLDVTEPEQRAAVSKSIITELAGHTMRSQQHRKLSHLQMAKHKLSEQANMIKA